MHDERVDVDRRRDDWAIGGREKRRESGGSVGRQRLAVGGQRALGQHEEAAQRRAVGLEARERVARRRVGRAFARRFQLGLATRALDVFEALETEHVRRARQQLVDDEDETAPASAR